MQHQTLQDKLCMYECRKKECIYEKSNPHEMQKNIHTRLIQDYERCLFGKICLIRDVLSFILTSQVLRSDYKLADRAGPTCVNHRPVG